MTRRHAPLGSYAAARKRLLGDEGGGGGAEDGHPPNLVCKVTLQLFDEPVTTKHGHTFSRGALLEMLRRKPACPISGYPLTVTEVEQLPVTVAVRDAVAAYKRSQPWWDADEVVE